MDKGPQHAYIHAIRKAERFIYLENQCAAPSSQAAVPIIAIPACEWLWCVILSITGFGRYFQGGSAEWGLRGKRELCPNLVPTEIALKVAAKIRARQPFAAYVLIPFWQVHKSPSLCAPSVADATCCRGTSPSSGSHNVDWVKGSALPYLRCMLCAGQKVRQRACPYRKYSTGAHCQDLSPGELSQCT